MSKVILQIKDECTECLAFLTESLEPAFLEFSMVVGGGSILSLLFLTLSNFFVEDPGDSEVFVFDFFSGALSSITCSCNVFGHDKSQG